MEMNTNVSWNPVLNKFVEIKQDFVKKFGEGLLWDYNPEKEACLQYWVRMLGREDYTDLILPLKMNEYDGKLNLHYGSMEMLYSNYDLTGFWDKYNGFYRECRGVVLDIKNDKLLLTPFKKFMNMNECEENSLENILQEMEHADTIEISEKLDGSMISGRHVDFTDAGLSENNITANHILLASSGQINPDSCIQLKEAYRLLTKRQYIAMKHNRELTFIYELIAPNIDPHIVDYSKKERGLYLIGLRDVNTGKELPYNEVLYIAKGYGIPVTSCVSASLLDFNNLLKTMDTKKSYEAEGFVVNVDGHRFKLKYDDYCLMHKAMSSIVNGTATNGKVIAEMIIENQYDDFYARVPSAYKPRVAYIANKMFLYDKLYHEEVKNMVKPIMNLPTKEAMLYIDYRLHASWQAKGYAKYEYLKKEWSALGMKRGSGYVGRPSMEDIDSYLEAHSEECKRQNEANIEECKKQEKDYDRD